MVPVIGMVQGAWGWAGIRMYCGIFTVGRGIKLFKLHFLLPMHCSGINN